MKPPVFLKKERRIEMECYKKGGCGVYENRSCNECPASTPEYAEKYEALRGLKTEAKVLGEEYKRAYDEHTNKLKPIVRVKVFLDEDGVRCVMKNTDVPVEIEFVDEVAIANAARDCCEADMAENDVDAYINKLCGAGYVYIKDENIVVTNDLLEGEHRTIKDYKGCVETNCVPTKKYLVVYQSSIKRGYEQILSIGNVYWETEHDMYTQEMIQNLQKEICKTNRVDWSVITNIIPLNA